MNPRRIDTRISQSDGHYIQKSQQTAEVVVLHMNKIVFTNLPNFLYYNQLQYTQINQVYRIYTFCFENVSRHIAPEQARSN